MFCSSLVRFLSFLFSFFLSASIKEMIDDMSIRRADLDKKLALLKVAPNQTVNCNSCCFELHFYSCLKGRICERA
jgi:hypothetical protein